MKRARLSVDRTWNGASAWDDERANVSLTLSHTHLIVDIDAPFHGDPPPTGPPGSLDGLWEFEVVEVFLLGDSGRYLELEFGPFGHYLVLELEGPRNVLRRGLPLVYTCERHRDRWTGRARLPASRLPRGLRSWNAYAIHGRAATRRYLAAHPVRGAAPDFHRLEAFGPLEWAR